MKFGQVIKYNKRNVFLQNYAENEKLVPDLFFWNIFIWDKGKWSTAIVLNLVYNKNKL